MRQNFQDALIIYQPEVKDQTLRWLNHKLSSSDCYLFVQLQPLYLHQLKLLQRSIQAQKFFHF